MIFLFEDKEEDTLSCLLRKSFDTNSIPFVYANGNGRLVEKATELLEKEDIIIVLLDTVPANKSIRDVYLTLRRLSRKNDFRIIIWKSEMYRREYGCFKASDCSVEEAWEIHEKLLEEANEMIVKYNHLGYKEILPYPTIKCNQNTN